MVRVVLALLFALSTVQQGAAELYRSSCADQIPCGGLDADRVGDAGAIRAVAPVESRTGIDTQGPLQHRTGDANTRAGTDALFHRLIELLHARARVSMREFRAAVVDLHDATQGTASAPTRAPPRPS